MQQSTNEQRNAGCILLMYFCGGGLPPESNKPFVCFKVNFDQLPRAILFANSAGK